MTDVAVKPYSGTLGTSAATLLTVPSGFSYVIRSIVVVNETGSTLSFTMSIGADATSTRIYNATNVQAAHDPFEWTGFLVLNSGEIMQGFASGVGLVATIAAVQSS